MGIIGLMYVNDNGKHPTTTIRFIRAAEHGWEHLTSLPEKGIGICPSTRLREPLPTSGNGQGTADKAWVRWTSDNKIKFFGSYGFNSWLYTHDPEWNPAKRPYCFNGEANIQKPSATPVFADENWVDADPFENEPYFTISTPEVLCQVGRITWEDSPSPAMGVEVRQARLVI